MQPLRVGVVGLGKMGILHTSILNILPSVQVVAFCEKSRMMRGFLGKLFKKVQIVENLEKLYKFDLDAVYVTTPIPSHYSIVRDIYEKNIAINLFVEKTLASSYSEARELCNLAGMVGGVNMVGYPRRFAVTFEKARDILIKEALGKPISFKASAYSSDFYGVKDSLKASTSRGGVLRDLGCHIIDVATWFFGRPDLGSIETGPTKNCYSDDSTNFTALWKNGLSGEFDISWCVKDHRMPEVRLTISCSRGVINVNDDRVDLETQTESSTWHRHDLHDTVEFWLGGPEYYRENDFFIGSIFKGRNAEPSFRSASEVDQIIETVLQKV